MAKRGRRPNDNLHKIRDMMLRIEDGMGIQPAAKASDPKNPEGLRRKFYRLQASEQLPESAPVRPETVELVKRHFKLSRQYEIEDRERLAVARKKLEAFGYDPDQEDQLHAERKRLLEISRSLWTQLNDQKVVTELKKKGIETEQEVLEKIAEWTAEREDVSRRIHALTEYLQARGSLGP